jgi:nicotinamidase-related amidase
MALRRSASAGHVSFATSHPGRAPFETVALSYGYQVLWPTYCVQGTDGAELAPGLDLPRAELIIRKGFPRKSTATLLSPKRTAYLALSPIVD